MPPLKKQAQILQRQMDYNGVNVVLHILGHTHLLKKYFSESYVYDLNPNSKLKGKLAKQFSEYIQFLEMSKLHAFSDVTDILSIAEYFKP